MADSATIVFRPMFIEDLAQSATLAQTTSPILNVGSAVTVTPFLTASGDAAAETAGANAGDVYIDTEAIPYRLRAAQNLQQVWNPTASSVTSLTINSFSVAYAVYSQQSNTVHFYLYFTASFGGTTNNNFYVNMPVMAHGGASYYYPANAIFVTTGIGLTAAAISLVQQQNLYIQTPTNVTLGQSYSFYVSGFYQI